MTPWAERIKCAVFFNPWLKWLALPLAAATVIGTVMSQVTPLSTPQVALAASPLYAQGARAKPALMLALSVEFPTVGAQYLAPNGTAADSSYSAATQYIGYFDSEGCYVYNDNPQEAGATAFPRFDRSKDATNHTCGGDSFSGNFMNWASSSAIDILRYGLTGGDRIVDLGSLTVLQRAVLPNANVSSNFWNGTNFPDKQISTNNGAAASVLPTSMIGSYTGTIHIANCLNRIHFGSAATGSCASPGNNSVFGVTQPTVGHGPVTGPSPLPASPNGFVYCATENGACSFTGVMQVVFGAGNSWLYMSASNGATCSNSFFGSDPAYGMGKSCYLRPDPTGWTAPTTTGALTTDNFFYTRVSVCSSDVNGLLLDPRPTLCQRYPSGQYKPTGNLQKYSDRVRVSAFGYLNDSTNNPNQRYGGVLRAPMKYVGPTAYDANFSLISGANPNQEWDPQTGIFFANPDNNTTVASGPSYNGPYLSGVTNYLNQFGRTGILGQYKTYDPVSELYYESLRYLQGLPPTSQAYTPLTGQTTQALDDGYPVFTTWADPNPAVAGMSNYACVRNNIFVVGDIHTHNDGSIPGNTTRTTNDFLRTSDVAGTANPSPSNQPDFYYWMKVVGGFESGTAVSYLDGNGNTQSTTSPADPNPITSLWGLQDQQPVTAGGDGATYYIAGVAYWANTHDIRGTGWTAQPSLQRPGMRVTTYVLDVNEYGNSSDPNYHTKTQFFLASKYGGFNDASATGNPFKAADGSVSNNDWQSPSAPGEANTYYLSSSAQAVLNGLNQIFASVAAQAGSIAGGAISTQTLNSVPGAIYQAQFNPAGWTGEVAAYPVTTSASGVVNVATAPSWQASVELTAKVAATTPGGGNRDIVIGNSNAATATASDFNWSGSLPADVQTAMRTPPYAATGAPLDPVSTGQARLNFLRGDQSNESPKGLLFRTRTSVLGDVVNSAVVFSGAPSQDISDAAYTTFLASYANRKHALFVGANDGMLHAFDPDHPTINGDLGGNELFAYIPSWLIPQIGALTSPSYAHQSYVDATPAVAEAKVGTSWASGVWKTVLVGGTGGGGAGVYALDVSDPAAFSASKVMWEFTVNDDAEIGEVIGAPQILKFKTSANGAAADYQYFAVVAGGVNNYANSGFKPGTSSPATLFLLDLSKPVGTPWKVGVNYFKVEFGAAATTTANGMVNFNTVPNDDGSVKALYAGDLQGNLWKLDFTQAVAGKADWNLGKLSYYQSTNGPVPMFIAKSATNVRQPITMQPALSYGVNRSIIVSFGTGKYLEASDNTTTGAPQQSVYSLLDNGTNTLDSGTSSNAAIAGRGRLQQATASAATGTISVPAVFNWGRPLSDTDTTQNAVLWFAHSFCDELRRRQR
jgi:type IV pilus assembly protein PilY1